MSQQPPTPATARTWKRTDVAILAGVLAVAVLFRLVFFRGLYAFDDFNYLRHAAEIWRLEFDLEQVLYWHGMRTFIFVPIALIFAVFGVSEATAIAWPFLASLLGILVVYRLGALLAGRTAGALAGLALAVLPIAVEGSTKVMPGVFIALLTSVAATAYVRSELIPRRRSSWLALSGVLFAGIPWAGHLGLVFGVFFVLALVLYRRHPMRTYWPLAAGTLAVVALALVLQLLVTRDPVANLSVSRAVLETETPTPRPLFYLHLLVRPLSSHGGVFLLSAFGGLAALVGLGRAMRNVPDDRSVDAVRGALLVLSWFCATYLILEFGSTSLTEYRPLFKQARYLSMLAVPGALLAGIGGAWLVGSSRLEGRRSGRRAWGVFVGVVFLAAALGSVETLRRATPAFAARREPLDRLAAHVRAFEGRQVFVTHWLWNTRVGFFMGYDERYMTSGYAPYQSVRLETADASSRNRYVQTLPSGEPVEGGMLLNDERLLRSSIGPTETRMVREGEIPLWLSDPPLEWRLIERIGEVALYEVPPGWVAP